jgi:hypothetical protein
VSLSLGFGSVQSIAPAGRRACLPRAEFDEPPGRRGIGERSPPRICGQFRGATATHQFEDAEGMQAVGDGSVQSIAPAGRRACLPRAEFDEPPGRRDAETDFDFSARSKKSKSVSASLRPGGSSNSARGRQARLPAGAIRACLPRAEFDEPPGRRDAETDFDFLLRADGRHEMAREDAKKTVRAE